MREREIYPSAPIVLMAIEVRHPLCEPLDRKQVAEVSARIKQLLPLPSEMNEVSVTVQAGPDGPPTQQQVVSSFPDVKVQKVSSFPDSCGKWQFVTAFPDTKVQFVTAFPDVKIIAVEPATSAVLSGGKPSPHRLQGIGAGFIPKNLDRDLLTEVRTVGDRDAYQAKTRLAREEGLLVGISAGAAVHVALQVAAELGPQSTVVTVLCDTGERYFSLDEYFA